MPLEASPERVRSLLLKFYRRLSADDMVGFFFDGKDLESIAGRQANFIEAALGRKRPYTGKPPSEAHEEIPPIMEGHFNRRLVLLEEVLVEAGLSPESRQEWLGFERLFAAQVIRG